MTGNLDALFSPRSVALIGASADPGKIGNVVLRNLSKGSFRFYPVNPKHTQIMGLRCYPSIADTPGPVDLAVVSLPARLTVDAVKDCVIKGVKVVIVTSSGFRESGPDGLAAEMEMVQAIRGSGTRLLGPNTMGVFIPSVGLDTLLIPPERSPRPESGPVAIISQSGAVSISFLERARAAGVGISACVGLGNKGDINENELLAHFEADPKTKCIALYLESFVDGRAFVRLAEAASKVKPIVLLKAGRSLAGSGAAASHTGAIAATSDGLVAGALRQARIVRVFDEEELLDIAKALSVGGHIGGDRICIIASAGGYGVIAADYVESTDHGMGMRMASLSEETVRALRAIAPPFTSVRNPVDLTAGVTDEMYDKALEALQRDSGVDGIMMSLELQPPKVTEGLVDVAIRRSRSGQKPIVVCVFGGDKTEEVIRKLQKGGVAAYPTLLRAVRALAGLACRGKHLH